MSCYIFPTPAHLLLHFPYTTHLLLRLGRALAHLLPPLAMFCPPRAPLAVFYLHHIPLTPFWKHPHASPPHTSCSVLPPRTPLAACRMHHTPSAYFDSSFMMSDVLNLCFLFYDIMCISSLLTPSVFLLLRCHNDSRSTFIYYSRQFITWYFI